jgi:lysyl-tRNA synthetase class 2
VRGGRPADAEGGRPGPAEAWTGDPGAPSSRAADAVPGSEEATWRPTASWDALRRRAEILAAIRAFFAARGVLEVETPVLSAATVTDLHLASFATTYRGPGAPAGRCLYLQTSPEFAMKRLLAAGSGPIFQLAKSFRDAEVGERHNPEFTMLEWYRPGFDHHQLMDEMDALLATVLASRPAERLGWGEAFRCHVGVDGHRATAAELAAAAEQHGLGSVAGLGTSEQDRDAWLHLLMATVVEPLLGGRDASGALRPTFLYDFPATQAALAQVRPADAARGLPAVAERFEVYVAGVELANGFHELADAVEQRRRFTADLAARAAAGLPAVPLDEHLLAALASGGFPPCAGVALGVDRLVMIALGARSISEVLAFPVDRA